MPLLKRKADGQFEDWRGSSTAASSPPQPPSRTSTDAPSAKRPKVSAEQPARPRVSPRKAKKDAPRSSPTPIHGQDDWFADKDNGYSSQPAASSSQRPSTGAPSAKEHRKRARPSPRKATQDVPRSNPTQEDWFADKDNGYSSQPAASSSQRPSQAPPMHKAPPPPVAAAIHMPAYKPPPAPQPSPSKSAKTPKPKTPAKSKEKRQARFRSSAPQAILQRLDRVASQRFFMVDREREGDELKEVFSVLGSTGNIYKVTIDHLPRCDCPDFQKGNHCKHIIFIFTKVLQVSSQSTHWYQKALLTEELEEVFNNAPLAPNALANERVREAYARATGKTPNAASGSQSQKTRKMPGEEDDCPICYESMHKQPEAKLEWCDECGNALHKECFGQWRTTQRNAGKRLTCVWCRANWIGAAGTAGAGAEAQVGAGGYLNLSQAAGLSPQRDTSSYYMGPRRGQHFYGYQHYEDD